MDVIMSENSFPDTAPFPDNLLDSEHFQQFRRALENILSTGAAEYAFATVLDGSPSAQICWEDMTIYDWKHPICRHHRSLCDGVIELAREFLAQLEPQKIRFPVKLLDAFTSVSPGSLPFHLRLVEMVATACHEVGAIWFKMDKGMHKNAGFEEWEPEKPRRIPGGPTTPMAHPTPLQHPKYRWYEQYPQGIADVVGYWVELRLFGGVVLFQRGKQDGNQDEKVFIHPSHLVGLERIYALSQAQLSAFISFLLSKTPPTSRPFPFWPCEHNSFRLSVGEAWGSKNIYRHGYERHFEKMDPESVNWCGGSMNRPDYAWSAGGPSNIYCLAPPPETLPDELRGLVPRRLLDCQEESRVQGHKISGMMVPDPEKAKKRIQEEMKRFEELGLEWNM